MFSDEQSFDIEPGGSISAQSKTSRGVNIPKDDTYTGDIYFTEPLNILLVLRQSGGNQKIADALNKDNRVTWVHTSTKAKQALSEASQYDLCLIEAQLRDGVGLDLIEHLLVAQISLPIVFVTETGNEDMIGRALALGAHAYLLRAKDDDKTLLTLLPTAVKQARQHWQNASKSEEADLKIGRMNRQLISVQYVGAAIASSMNLDFALNTLMQEMLSLFNVDGCTIFKLNRARDTLMAVASKAYDNHLPPRARRVLQEYPLTKQILAKRRWQQLTSTEADLRIAEFEYMQEEGLKTLLLLPMEFQEQIVGLIELRDYSNEQPLSLEESSLAQFLANQAASAITNSESHTNKQRRISELESVYEANLNLTSSLELPDVLEAILRNTFSLLSEARNAHIYLYQDETLKYGAGLWSTGERDTSPDPPRPNGLTYNVARSGEPISMANVRHHHLYQDVEPDWAGALLGMPLKIEDEVVGVMNISRYQTAPWLEAELRVLHLFADQAALAIKNARLYEQAQQDIRKRQQAEAELNAYKDMLEQLVQERTAELETALVEAAQARDKIDAILQSVADGLIVTDLDQRVVLANHAAEALLGFDFSEMLGREIGVGIKNARLRTVMQETLAKQTSGYEIDLMLEDPRDGETKIMRVRTSLVDDQQGKRLGTVLILEDATRLREIDRLKSEFLSTAAHQLRTPLTSILGFSEILLSRDIEPERYYRFLQTIHERAGHLSQVVDELLDVSRLGVGSMLQFEPTPIEVSTLWYTLYASLPIDTDKYQVYVENLNELPPVVGDSHRLTQVARNLLLNAVKYSPDGGAIRVHGEQVDAETVQIQVSDEGVGMTQQQQQYLFQPFYRADASNTAVDGIGLGLALSKMIIEQHGGKIWVESEYGVGTTVYFTLPIAPTE